MAILSTGPIDNSVVSGDRPTKQVTVKIDNRDSVNFSILLIQGYLLNGSRMLNVLELFSITPNQVVTKTNTVIATVQVEARPFAVGVNP